MAPKSPLDDPDYAQFAWARYRRLMRFMMTITLLMVGAACFALFKSGAMVSAHFYVATALGIGVSMLLMSALMGLVFLSNGTGHDASVTGHSKDDDETGG